MYESGAPAASVHPVEGIRLLVLDRIRSGEFPAEEPAPSTRRLAAELGYHQTTVLRAYARLTAQGLLARRGRSFVVTNGHE
jgi:DNA-binding transcriptional regulator YhcF (GntR family)